MDIARASRRLLVAWSLVAAQIAAAQPNPYRTVDSWLDLAGFRPLGNVSAVYPKAGGGFWIAERCGGNDCAARPDLAPIIAVDQRGRYQMSFGAGAFVWPHGLHVDVSGNVWVADGRGANGHGFQVVKFSPDGRELMRLGEAGVAGSGHAQFSGPTGVAVAADGSIFVTDGHEPESNHRIMKFSADGTYVMEWGGKGSAPGQFNVPHAIALDSRGRVFVADRDNDRIQIFDQNGVFLEQWTQFGRPSGIFIDANDKI
jgi:sugar lactone lactonase YvrE